MKKRTLLMLVSLAILGTLRASAQMAEWRIPRCATIKLRGKRIRTGILSYDVPNGFKVRKVTDADYAEYLVFSQDVNSTPALQLWVAVNNSPSPPNEYYENSESYSQRKVVLGDLKEGLDTKGKTKGAKYWRVTGAGVESAVYRDVPEQMATSFDSIIESVCYEPRIR